MQRIRKIMAAGAAALATTTLLGTVAALAGRPAMAAEPVRVATATRTAVAPAQADAAVARGRYLVSITGCNDCHTAGYPERGGIMPTTDWLTGSPVGFKGPWGVSYAANLRLTVQGLTEDQWLAFARAERRPPMPWFALRDMSDADLRAVYRFIRSLGAAGQPAPQAVAPGGVVRTPYIPFMPQDPPPLARR